MKICEDLPIIGRLIVHNGSINQINKLIGDNMVVNKSEIDKSPNINHLLNRGMTTDEVQKLLTAPMPDRERAFLRAVYETFFRAQELLRCNIEDFNRQTGELTAHHTKNKYNPKTKQHIQSPPKHMVLSKPTQLLFKVRIPPVY